MGGGEKYSKVLSSLTLKIEQITAELYKGEPSGSIDIMNALKVSSLILKNREQKHFHQRIVLFVASPIKDKSTVKDYKAMGEQLKKAEISLDIISTGEISDNYDKLHALFDGALKNKEDSHFLTLAGGSGSLTDVLLCSPILNPSSSSGAGGNAGDGGEPPVEDDLARAIRESMAESDAAIDEELQKAMMASLMDFNAQNIRNDNNNSEEPKKEDNQAPPPPPAAATAAAAAPEPAFDDDLMDIEDEELKEAIRMSLMEVEDDSSSSSSSTTTNDTAPAATEEPKKEEEKKKEDEKKEEKKSDDKGMSLDNIDPTELIDDPDYVNSVLSGLDGVDPEEAKKYLDGKKKDGDDDDDDKDKK